MRKVDAPQLKSERAAIGLGFNRKSLGKVEQEFCSPHQAHLVCFLTLKGKAGGTRGARSNVEDAKDRICG